MKKNMSSQQGKLTYYCLLVLLIWLPIPLASNRPWAWGLMNIACFLILFSTCVISSAQVKNTLYKFKIPLTLLAIFITWIALQILPLPISVIEIISPKAANLFAGVNKDFATVSVDPAQSTILLLKTLAYSSIFVCTLVLCNSVKRIKVALFFIIGSGLFQAMYGALEVLLGFQHSLFFEIPNRGVATGTFVYKNHYANYLMLCLSIGVGFLVSTLLNQKERTRSRQRLRNLLETLLHGKAFVRIALAIMVIALVMSHSRMGNTSFFVAMTVVGLACLTLIKTRSRGLTILIISMFVIDMFILSAWFGLDKVKERLEQTTLTQETRDEVVRDSIPLLLDFPLTGSGLGSYYGIFPNYKGEDINLFYDHAHNDYLQFAIEAGIPATICLFTIAFLAIIACIKAIRVRRNNLLRGVAFGAAMAIIGMSIHMTMDFPLQAPANAALFMFILALAFQANNKDIRN